MTMQSYAKAEILIRKPVAEVFEAFVNPEITTKFWFTSSSGRLEQDKEIEWTWEMYNHSVSVLVKSIEPDKKIVVEWENYDELTSVEFTFKILNENATFVSIVNNISAIDTEKLAAQIRDSTEGFTMVLAGLKAYLEHGIELNLIADRFPAELNAK